ncbi:hypothetical protein NEOLEDRAFT_1174595 [Neolentinus lepideus HHB14362 ss-1]|uniref:Uncharacterized protein n=1 Tax=Neolentinus lepideus HHB14362 ss-1 TaxID=1314782 RepID=A0A165VWF0_9AGAM|nr:hypothetical protein NEOLEDRAFT_1174595 [Neolentinus lepideus HHB14362 ss-1]
MFVLQSPLWSFLSFDALVLRTILLCLWLWDDVTLASYKDKDRSRAKSIMDKRVVSKQNSWSGSKGQDSEETASKEKKSEREDEDGRKDKGIESYVHTVERNILDLAARQGVSLYTKEKCQGTLDLTSIALDTAKDIDAPAKKNPKAQKGDFIFKMDDMLAILFPHMFEDIEYLIPLEQEDRTSGRASNAIAGPSRTSS